MGAPLPTHPDAVCLPGALQARMWRKDASKCVEPPWYMASQNTYQHLLVLVASSVLLQESLHIPHPLFPLASLQMQCAGPCHGLHGSLGYCFEGNRLFLTVFPNFCSEASSDPSTAFSGSLDLFPGCRAVLHPTIHSSSFFWSQALL